MKKMLLLILAAGSTVGCSSIVEGTSQQIMVNTNPPGADCGLYREGIRIATVQNTPGSALVNKTKHDIWVVCVKSGYEQASYFNKSAVAGATAGNIILGGGIGWIIDSATGADNKYDSPINLSMTPSQTASTAATVLPATFMGPVPVTASAPSQPTP